MKVETVKKTRDEQKKAPPLPFKGMNEGVKEWMNELRVELKRRIRKKMHFREFEEAERKNTGKNILLFAELD